MMPRSSILFLFGLSLLIPPSLAEGFQDDFEQSFSITEKQVRYVTPYKITNGILDDVKLNCDSATLSLLISSNDAGTIHLDMPQMMFGGIFMVHVNESEWDDVSIDKNVLTVNFPANTSKIEIFGTYYITPDRYTGVCDVAHDPPYSYLLPPLKQLQSGILFDEIKCDDDLVLIQKYDSSPSCVESRTIPKLIQRGWIDVDPREEADKNIPKYLCELYGGGFFDGTGECMDLESSIKCKMLGGTWNDKCIVLGYAGKGIGTEPDFDPHPEPPSLDPTTHHLIDAENKLRELYQIDPSLGPFLLQDAIVSFGIDDGILAVDILDEYYNSVKDRDLVIKKITELINDETVNIEFSISDGVTPKNIEPVFPYVWNRYLHKHNLSFTPQDVSYANTDEGYHFDKENKVCSPLVSSSGTEFYIISTFIKEPFEITGTFIEQTQPNDCQKIWKTNTILLEPDRILGLWVNNFFDDPKNFVWFANYSINGLDSHYSIDELVSFEFIETGYGDPCIPIKIVYYQDRVWMENIVLVDKIIRDCPVGVTDEFLFSSFDTSKDTEIVKNGDWVDFPRAGEYFIEIVNENQPDGKVIASFKVN